MKHHLKTFPSQKATRDELNHLKDLGLKYIRYDMVRIGLIEKWMEYFTAELRARAIVAAQRSREYGECVDGGYEAGIADLANEIMGEVDTDVLGRE